MLSIDPRHADSLHCLGAIAFQSKRQEAAINLIYEAIQLNGDIPLYHYNLGRVLSEQGKKDKALACYKRAIVLNPDFAEACNNLGAIFSEQDNLSEAVEFLERSIASKPDFAEAHNNLGSTLRKQGKLDEAVARYSRAIAIRPDYVEAYYNLGRLFCEQGKLDEAVIQYERAIAIKPDYTEAHLSRAEIKTFHQGDPDIATLETMIKNKSLDQNKVMGIHFTLSKALEDCGDYVRAFEHLRAGNAMKRRQINYDETSVLDQFQRITAVFNKNLFDRFRGEGDPSSVPVFVLGMPRSGSTLVEQILASHPQIHGAGELSSLETVINSMLRYPECIPTLDDSSLQQLGQDYLSRLPTPAKGKIRVIDKTPGNFFSIGLIRLILPKAKIIHTRRDPIDTCFSCYSILFSDGLNFSYDLAELGRYYRRYSELMGHWQSVLPPSAMLDVYYEDVVDDLEGQARRLIEYCGLPWDDTCLEFYRNSRPVKTASAVQVRKPLYRSSLKRWHKYEENLEPLLHQLGDIIPGSTGALADTSRAAQDPDR